MTAPLRSIVVDGLGGQPNGASRGKTGFDITPACQ